jgi:hypothetical protein
MMTTIMVWGSSMVVAVTHATVLLATDSSFLRQSAQQWATKMFPSTVKVKVVWYQVRDMQHIFKSLGEGCFVWVQSSFCRPGVSSDVCVSTGTDQSRRFGWCSRRVDGCSLVGTSRHSHHFFLLHLWVPCTTVGVCFFAFVWLLSFCLFV